MKKRVLSLFLAVLLLAALLPVPRAAAAGEVERYTVLVLDTSSSADFLHNGAVFYTADTAIPYVKAASKKFVEDVQKADGTNYLAVVSYTGDSASVVSGFTTDTQALIRAIDGLSAQNDTRSVYAGLRTANELLDSLGGGDGIVKNVVLFTTGMTNYGPHSYSGHYGESTIASDWYNVGTNINLYAYANTAYAQAEVLKTKANVYTVGLFQVMDNMPDAGRQVVEFFKLFTLELASSPNHFYDVKDPSDLEFIFGQVAADLRDSDNDGLPDIWERDGVTLDGVFFDLPAMGADPSVPDVFVEVDWMVRPKSKVLWFETAPEISLAPSANAMRMVYEAFRQHGINLHIDAGPSSTDFVTGKVWGSKSGGNQVPYEANFKLGGNYEHWNSVAAANFNSARASIFKYCIFIDQYNGGTSSGIANGIPGQYFLVANQDWLRNTGDTGVAGTFMHELGHTLGLCHGGHNSLGEGDHTHYKPNYLSIMNYLFQTSGLEGTGRINYSDYRLPDLDENALVEGNGIDPEGLTSGTGLGTRFKRKGFFSTNEYTVQPVALTGVDFDGKNGVGTGTVAVDINGDGYRTVLTSSNDWEHINFKGGDLGKEYAYIAGIEAPDQETAQALEEATLTDLLDAGSLGRKGAGSVESVGAVTMFAGTVGQNLYLRVSNLGPEASSFTLAVSANPVVKAFHRTVTVAGSDKQISYVDIPVPLVDDPAAGTYQVTARLTSPEMEEAVERTFPVSVYSPTEKEKAELDKALTDGKLDDLLPGKVIDAYQALLNGTEPDESRHFQDVTQEDWFYDAVYYCSGKNYFQGVTDDMFDPEGNMTRAMFATVLYRMAGEPAVTGKSPFTDVPDGQWYSNGIIWAAGQGIVGGYGDGRFGPDDHVTRQELVTMLWRWQEKPSGASADLSVFHDAGQISNWALDGMKWGVSKQVIRGKGSGQLDPVGTATRAEVAQLIMNYETAKK